MRKKLLEKQLYRDKVTESTSTKPGIFDRYFIKVERIPPLDRLAELIKEEKQIPGQKMWDNMAQFTSELQHINTYGQRMRVFFKEKPVEIQITETPKELMFIGFDSPDYIEGREYWPEINILSYEGGQFITKSKVGFILGDRDTGKTIFMSVIILDNIVDRYGSDGIKVPVSHNRSTANP